MHSGPSMGLDAVPTPSLNDYYDPKRYATLFPIEDRHFWFRARNRTISVVVGRTIAPMQDGYRVLEIGCGTGNTMRVLESVSQRGLVVGMDRLVEGLQYARLRTGCALVQGDMRRLPFGVGFDLIGLFDVLEHLPDDVEALQSVFDNLVPGGALVLTVPAHMSLWSYHDDIAHHCRRYSIHGLESKLVDIGYLIEYSTYYMATIFPLVWFVRRVFARKRLDTIDATSDENGSGARELRIVPVINRFLAYLLDRETRLIEHRRKLPFGTSIVAVARKS